PDPDEPQGPGRHPPGGAGRWATATKRRKNATRCPGRRGRLCGLIELCTMGPLPIRYCPPHMLAKRWEEGSTVSLVRSPISMRATMNNEELQPLKKQPRAGKASRSGTQDDVVYAHIFDVILEQRLAPGTKLSEEAL